MQQKEWEARYQWMRRATTGRNVLGWIALGFMAGFGYFWYSIWAIVFAPPSFFSPQGIVAAMISVVYTVVLPLFWSMIIPNSPAGRLLQKQTWALPGQIVILILACLLSGVAIRAFQGWLSQPQIDPGLYYPALLAMTTAAIFVPALCWAATTPEQFIALYESARIAKQLEQQAQLEDLKFKALHARFCAVGQRRHARANDRAVWRGVRRDDQYSRHRRAQGGAALPRARTHVQFDLRDRARRIERPKGRG
jgi:hypothetical protein